MHVSFSLPASSSLARCGQSPRVFVRSLRQAAAHFVCSKAACVTHVFVPSFAQGAARFVCGEAACFALFPSLVAAGRRVYFVCGEGACLRSRLRAASSLRDGRWLPRSCGWCGQRSWAAQGTQSGRCGSRVTGRYACSEKYDFLIHHAAMPRAIDKGTSISDICIY